MANKRLVWSGGNGTGGSIAGAPTAGDWTNAYTTLQAGLTARTENEEVWVHVGATSTHTESYATTQTLTAGVSSASDLVLIKGVDKDNSNVAITTPSTTVNFEVTVSASITIAMSCVLQGLYLKAAQNIFFNQSNALAHARFCKFEFGTGSSVHVFRPSGSTGMYCQSFIDDCEIKSNSTAAHIDCPDGFSRYSNLTVNGTYNSNGVFRILVTVFTYIEVFGSNLSSLASGTTIVAPDSASDTGLLKFVHCKFPTNFVVTSGWEAGNRILLLNCDSGNILYRNEVHTFAGDTKPDSATFLTAVDADKSGSTTGTKISFKMTPRGTQAKRHTPFEGVPIVAYISSTGSKTFTLEAVENFTTALKNSEAWIEVQYLSEAASPLWASSSTKELSDHLEANLTAGVGTGSWTSPPTGSRSVKFTKTITVNHVGYYVIVPYLGNFETGKVLHYNPQVTVT